MLEKILYCVFYIVLALQIEPILYKYRKHNT